MKKAITYILGIILLFVGYMGYTTYPKFDIINGFSSKNITSCVFLTHRSQELAEAEDNNVPGMEIADNEIDMSSKSVSSSVYGLKKRMAVYTEGLGAILLPEGKTKRAVLEIPNRKKAATDLIYPYGNLPQKDTVFQHINYEKLTQAVDLAFDTPEDYIKKTRAVLVLHQGHIIAEKYREGFDENSIMMGWSMTKSVTSTVLGILAKQGKVSLDQNHLFEAWEADDRKNITLANLLNMNSGLEWEEDYTQISDATKMLFLAENMSEVQLQKSLTHPTNESWKYSSGTTNLLSGFIRKQFNSQQAYLDFWYGELIDKIGMESMVIETDYAGNFVGSSYGWATMRDWAKLGILYLNEGHWNGEQIIDTTWVNFSKNPTNSSDGGYGGHFWLNAGGKYPDVPKDMYAAIGFQGQYVFIIPSENLVVVRTGMKNKEGFDINGFLKGIVEAVE